MWEGRIKAMQERFTHTDDTIEKANAELKSKIEKQEAAISYLHKDFTLKFEENRKKMDKLLHEVHSLSQANSAKK